MNRRLRKLIGAVMLLALVIVYALVAMAFAQGRITEAPAWAQVILYAFLGIAWILPAGLIIWWMEQRRKT